MQDYLQDYRQWILRLLGRAADDTASSLQDWGIIPHVSITLVTAVVTVLLRDQYSLEDAGLAVVVGLLATVILIILLFAGNFVLAPYRSESELRERLKAHRQHTSEKKRRLMSLLDRGRTLQWESVDTDEELAEWLERVRVFEGSVRSVGRNLLTPREWQRIENVDTEYRPGSFSRQYNAEHEKKWYYLKGLVDNIDNTINRI